MQRFKDAKMDELNKFEVFYAYEQVSDQGRQRLGTNWVLVEKIKDGKPIVKARLTIRGDLEDTEDVKTDASSVKKANVKTLLMIAATEGWEIRSSDVQSAFLQLTRLNCFNVKTN